MGVVQPIVNALNGFLIVYENLPSGIHAIANFVMLVCAIGILLNFIWSVLG